MKRVSLIVCVLSLSLRAAEPSAVDLAKAAIRKADVDMAKALAAHDRERFASFLADDIATFPGNLARGKEAMLKTWAPLFTDGGPKMTWEPLEVQVAASLDLGYTIGTYERRSFDEKGKPVVGVGSYVTIWRKQRDGAWRAEVDIGTPPGPAPTPVPKT